MASKPYSVVFAHVAEADLDGIYNYITHQLHTEPAASALIAKFKEKIMLLKEFPLSCPVKLQVLSHKEYRKLLVDNYIVFYRVDESNRKVYISRILYASRNYMELLEW